MSEEQKDLEIKANDLGKELGDDEVEAASGGSACGCVFAGYGKDDELGEGYDNECHCITAGFGSDCLDHPDNVNRCTCVIGGYGKDT
jgi:hypothetical protein